MADKHTIARPYARAIFDVAREADALQEMSESLNVCKELMKDGAVETFLGNPSLNDEQRLSFLQDLFARVAGETSVFAGNNKHGENFLKLLLEYGRVAVLPEIAERFDELKAEVENTVDVTVTSATPLSAEQQQVMARALQQRLGRTVNLTTETDENLIGGAVICAGDVVIDGSLRSRLENLSNALTA